MPNASLTEMIDLLAKRLKINYILDPAVRGTVSIFTYGEVKPVDEMQLLETILRINNATIVKVGDLYRIVPVTKVSQLPLSPSINGDPKTLPDDERMVLNLVFLKYATAAELSKLLQPFLGEGGTATPYEPANLLIIQDNARSMKRYMELLSLFDSDTFAEDLHKVVTHLKLRNFALVGFSMGGGEVARYLGKYGSKGVSKVVFIGAVPPFLLKTADNPEGVDGAVFDGIQKAIVADRYAFFTEFFKNFYNTDVLLGKRVSEQAVQASWNVASGASATASLACVPTWHEDFREDLKRVDVPALVIHGDADRIVPLSAAGLRTAKLIKGARQLVVKDGPHCITWTHADEVNRELADFLGKGVAKRAASTTKTEAVA